MCVCQKYLVQAKYLAQSEHVEGVAPLLSVGQSSLKREVEHWYNHKWTTCQLPENTSSESGGFSTVLREKMLTWQLFGWLKEYIRRGRVKAKVSRFSTGRNYQLSEHKACRGRGREAPPSVLAPGRLEPGYMFEAEVTNLNRTHWLQ